ncbi:class D sortase [Bacillus sp. FJAT-27445]|uniref:class D sortase n=1 Tax=Bacillus sp. FJAT-27445 TaxID=1679166 RepID=UPI0007437302|nr:class D sortase [Bacillus sp. FJAT-27445]
MKKTAAILLILVGCAFLLFPMSTKMYSEFMQKKLLEELEPSGQASAAESNSATEHYRGLDEVFSAEADLDVVLSAGPAYEVAEHETKKQGETKQASQTGTTVQSGNKRVSVQNASSEKKKRQPSSQVIGVLQIKKISLKIPILEGATMNNMRKGAGLITGTAMLGKPGNSAIAAHRSRHYGHMFNRLDELEKGDRIVIKDQNKTYIYKVFKKTVVKPTNTSVLNTIPQKQTLTLVTCTPIKTATHRLIVQAKLIDSN